MTVISIGHDYRVSLYVTNNSMNAQNGENEIISENCSTSKK